MLLLLTLILELLAADRLRCCVTLLLCPADEQPASGGAAGSVMGDQEVEAWVHRLPAVVCGNVITAAEQALRAMGLEQSVQLATRTVRSTVGEVLKWPMERAVAASGDADAHEGERSERGLVLRWAKRVLVYVNETLPANADSPPQVKCPSIWLDTSSVQAAPASVSSVSLTFLLCRRAARRTGGETALQRL